MSKVNRGLSSCIPKADSPIGKARIHLNVERWRVCEAWFSPTMAGVDSAGLGEVLQNILSRFSDAEKGKLVKVRSAAMRMSSQPADNQSRTYS